MYTGSVGGAGGTGALLFEEETDMYEGWNFNSGNYLFTTDTK